MDCFHSSTAISTFSSVVTTKSTRKKLILFYDKKAANNSEWLQHSLPKKYECEHTTHPLDFGIKTSFRNFLFHTQTLKEKFLIF